MIRRIALLLSVALPTFLLAQTQVVITNVKAVEKEATVAGQDVTVQLDKAEGSERVIVLSSGDLEAKVWVKVNTHNSRRSSLKDSAVNMIFEIDLKAGKDKDNKRVEKIFYLDQSRTATVTQRFNFKDGITMRGVTLSFDCEIK